MLNKRIQAILEIKQLPLMLLLGVASLKWFFEGVLDLAILELFLLSLGLGVLILQQKDLKKPAAPLWGLFAFQIVLNLLIHGSSFSAWGQGLITTVIVLYAVLYDDAVIGYRRIVRGLLILGIGVGVLVTLHWLFGEGFNSLYFPLLNAKEADLARNYYVNGYYFGVMYNPHEPAGLIAFAIAGLVLWNLIRGKWDIKVFLVAAALLFPLLLTTKKGIFGCLMLVLLAVTLIWFASRGRWRLVRMILLTLAGACAVVLVLTLLFPDVPGFSALHRLLMSLLSGQSADSTRTSLYRVAFGEFLEHPLFGTGWRSFNDIVMTKYGFSRGHEVNCDYLQFLCEGGLVGFGLCMTPLVVTAYRTFFVCRDIIGKLESEHETLIVLLSVFIQIFTLIYALFEIPFFDIVFISIYILSSIILNSAYSRREMKK